MNESLLFKNFKAGKILVFAALMSLIFLPQAMALPSTVRIVAFHLDGSDADNQIVMTNSLTKIGYYPDYRIQPDKGFKLSISDQQGTQRFNMIFQNPSMIYAHAYDNEIITGGLVILNETDFALTLPVYSDNDQITIWDEQNNQVFQKDFEVQRNAIGGTVMSGKWILASLILAVFLLVFIFIMARRMRNRQV